MSRKNRSEPTTPAVEVTNPVHPLPDDFNRHGDAAHTSSVEFSSRLPVDDAPEPAAPAASFAENASGWSSRSVQPAGPVQARSLLATEEPPRKRKARRPLDSRWSEARAENVYGVFAETMPNKLGPPICTAPTLGQARKRCETLQDFPDYRGKRLAVVRMRTNEVFHP